MAGFVELLRSMCQAVLGASKVSKDACPPTREDRQARPHEHGELSAMLAGEKSTEGEKWEGRRQRRRRVDRVEGRPREAVLGRMLEGWSLSKG